ncbi:eukaryotic glutathione synthase, ATP binding domain-containing protein [Ditylenchus destructor]|uniref:Glutathione synthetase n=1 Tax=Ditylenchus destructor TaxID=166010 RepID=A0AAD4NK96_9BILA|nr:eukaryotic glutathione synthase, ATP binding domain-containing protein [Ditylenchus destructor]
METSFEYVENLSIPSDEFSIILEDAVDWAHAYGLVLRTPDHKDRSDHCQTAPFALFPSPFPRALFQQAMDVQKAMNLLYFRLSWDIPFLVQCHEKVIETDEFTRRLVDILVKVQNDGIKQNITLLTQRADYMCHIADSKELQLKQIEVNNIAVSMGGLAQRATKFHQRILSKMDYSRESILNVVPENYPIRTLVNGIFQAWKKFNDPNAVVLVVVENTNQNQIDQKSVEFGLEEVSDYQIKCVRLTLTQSADRLSLLGNDFSLWIDGNKHKVAIVYFRAGYEPSSYPTEREWQARLLMERSNAIKCPWIGLQLANTKKIQQVLDKSDMVERYFPAETDNHLVSNIRATFAGLWGLEDDDEETRRVLDDAIDNPGKYVLKPQLEGGAGNYYDREISEKLKEFSPQQRAAHILMQKITPLTVKNYLIRPFHDAQLANVVSELGVYGCLVGDGKDMSVDFNETHGHILRSKSEGVNLGGVAVGAAVIDTPFLV